MPCYRTLHSVCKSHAKGIRLSWMTANKRKHPPFGSVYLFPSFLTQFYSWVTAWHMPPRTTRPFWCANSLCSIPSVRTTIHWIPSEKDLCLSDTHLRGKGVCLKMLPGCTSLPHNSKSLSPAHLGPPSPLEI